MQQQMWAPNLAKDHQQTYQTTITLQADFMTCGYMCEGAGLYVLCAAETEGAGEQLKGKQRQAAGGSGPPVSGD